MQSSHRESRGWLAVNIGLAANLLLAAMKTSIGVFGHSPSLLADGINSTSDVAYYIVVSVFMRQATKPADEEHPYGHRQLESIGALVVGSFVITTAVAIFWNSINTVYDLMIGVSEFSGAADLALWVALFTVALKVGLTFFTQKVGEQTKNAAVMALAYDHRNDIFSAMAAVIGIYIGRMGYYWVDPLAGAMVSLVVLRTGIEILRDSTADLMGTVPGKALKKQVEELLNHIPAIERIDEIQAHRFGPYLVLNITICVDGSISVTEGDHIATWAEHTLLDNVDYLGRVHVHFHPMRENS